MADDDGIVKTVELPSRGFFYQERIPDGMISMRPMRTSDEKLLAATSGDRTKILDKLIRGCLVSPAEEQMPYDEYLLGDKFFMMLYLRGITYGFNYDFKLK